MIGRVILIILCTCSIGGFGQLRKDKPKKKDVLFTVSGKPVLSEEFIYLYKKNHQTKPNKYSEKDILDYLDLYINFKLKVEEAKSRGMDTTTTFIKEFESYRDELLKPYLPEQKIIDSLTRLTYTRLTQEVRASHILISVKQDATPADTLIAFEKIMNLKKRLTEGENFESLAAAYSEDPSVRTNKGDLGYFTALQMVYPFETAAYETAVGEVSDPVRTKFGFHLVKVTDKRPAKGEVEVAHIMIRTGNDDQNAKDLIFNIYDQLNAGASWDELCRQYSEDQSSKDNNGKLRPFGAGAMSAVPEFERMAFTLQKPGEISDPFLSSYGWHIIRLERKIPVPAFDEIKSPLKTRVSKDERVQISQQAWQRKLKAEFAFKENPTVKSDLMEYGDSLLINKDAKLDHDLEHQVLFMLQKEEFTVNEFLSYVDKNQSKENDLTKLYDQYIDENLKKLLEEKIVKENPEFALLSNEYYEGILLFEIMEDEVWNKAADDSIGQRNYFKDHHAKYQAGERAKASLYSSSDSLFRPRLKKILNSQDSVTVARFVKTNNVREESGIYEKGSKEPLKSVAWQPGIYSAEYNGMYYIAQIFGILPAGEKTFEEARASVVADYQQEIENTWILLLREKYPVRINDKAKQYILDKLQK